MATATIVLAGCGPLVGLGAVGAMAASGGGGGAGPPAGASAPPAAAVAVVGPGGGTLTLTEGRAAGASISVPAGALASETPISIEPGSDIAGPGSVPVSVAVELGPGGLTFAVPVTLTLPVQAAAIPAGRSPADLVVLRLDAGGRAVLAPQRIDVVQGFVTAATSSFSTFQCHVGITPDPAACTVSVDRGVGVNADGTDFATVEVRIRDGFARPMPGRRVQIAATGEANAISSASGQISDAAGFVRATLASTRAELKSISATVDSGTASEVTLAQRPTVAFRSGAPATLAFAVEPTSTFLSAAITPAVEIRVTDAFGNRVDGGASVGIALGANAGAAQLTGTRLAVPVDGAAVFSDLRVDLGGSGYTLVATLGALPVAVSQPFSVTALPHARNLAFAVQPSAVSSGAAIAPPVAVAVVDATGRTVTNAADVVTLELGRGAPAPFSGGGATAAVAGVAIFPDLRLDRAGAGYTLRASAAGLATVESLPFDVGAGLPAALAFRVQPGSVEAGLPFSPPVQVGVLDAAGNLAGSPAVSVVLEIGPGSPASATLAGTVSVTAQAGSAAFPVLSIDQPGAGYTLRATATGLPPTTSAAFDVAVPVPPSFAGVTPSAGTTAGGTRIVISGAGFRPGMQVLVGGTALGQLTFSGTTSVAGQTPPAPLGATGFADVTLTTSVGSVTAANAFHYGVRITATSARSPPPLRSRSRSRAAAAEEEAAATRPRPRSRARRSRAPVSGPSGRRVVWSRRRAARSPDRRSPCPEAPSRLPSR